MVELAANAPERKRTDPNGVLEAEKLEEAILHIDAGKARTVINQKSIDSVSQEDWMRYMRKSAQAVR